MGTRGKRAKFLVDAQWLRDHRRDSDIVLIDTRPVKDYWSGHLRGARHFDPFPFHYYDTSERGAREFGAQLTWIFSALGITGRETVVFYEENSGMRAARGAWALEWLGHRRVRILDGGLGLAASEAMVKSAPKYAPAMFRGKPREDAAASYSYVLERLGRPDTQIFDVRSDGEYYGENVRAARGGAIPGAIHQDWTAAIDSAGAFRPAAELRASFEKLGLDPEAEVIPYCQGGYRSAHAFYALRIAGFERVRNYFGSWAEWGNRDDLPIEHPRKR